VNHLTGKETAEKRNVLVESARIARGKIQDVKNVKAADIDGLVFPGGYGAAKNLCDFAVSGAACKVQPEVARLAKEVHAAGKPLGFICIAPALAGKIFEGGNMKLTIGNEKETAAEIGKMGHAHEDCGVREITVDRKNKVVSTPAYMLARNVAEAYEGIEKLVKEVVSMAGGK
jgi:enhancing lycopene biosynthesis protein 2